MSEQNPEMPQASDQLSDILLVFDKEKMKIQAVKDIDKNGELRTVPPTKKNQNQFMRVDRHGDIFSNFFANFMSQLKNPTRFSFFKVPVHEAIKTAKELQEHVNKPSEQGQELSKKLEVKNEPKPANNPDMEVTQTTTPPSAEPQKVPEQRTARYQSEQVDWDSLAKFGLSKESLEKAGVVDDLLKGYKTNKLLPVTINTDKAVFRGEARLSLRTNDEGTVMAQLNGVRQEPELDLPFFGHKFTDEDKTNLRSTGNMGRVVDLTNMKTGEKIPSYISIDRLTNEVVAYRTSTIKIPDEIKGVKLDDHQKQSLAEGKPTYIEGMVSAKNTPFNATLQVNADKGYIEFIFNRSMNAQQTLDTQQRQDAPRLFRGYELNDQQYKRYNAGKSVAVNGLVSKEGKPYEGFIKFDFDTRKAIFSYTDPDRIYKQATQTAETPKQDTGKDQINTNQKQDQKKPKSPKKSASPKM
ncbi:Protein of unknown function [Chitinophaga eiseniae]|uniref:DUF3945 domain-containing protein n=1 Tax=Chitinophaga eiseniae TaxID=634771 RepID=A0A1T4SYC4_9BACT|nr:DUF3945 domain-containing protein [Chitinophaga eiseniae]SKA32928.1 Protein of unknown function [Chitinophaga eiseniae]